VTSELVRRVSAFGVSVGLAVLANRAVAQVRPPELVARAAALGLSGPILRFCPAEFEPGRRGGFAIAMRVPQETKGRYLAIDVDGPALELGTFTGDVDLSCYDAEQVTQLGAALKESGSAMHGQIVPRWTTTTVCGFVEPTRAICWQFDPSTRRFVEVGQWTT
jgi:hypothetical protein